VNIEIENQLSRNTRLHNSKMDMEKTKKIYTRNLLPGRFRLVQLHSGEWTEPIHCSLREYGLQDDPSLPDYTALSYSWGSPHVTDDIFLDEEPWPTTVNLTSALRFLRDPKRIVMLWIDALVGVHFCPGRSREI